MRITTLICLFVLLLTSGCYFHSRDISRLEPFSAYVGKTVTLQRPMALIGGGNWFFPDELRTFHKVDYCLVNVGVLGDWLFTTNYVGIVYGELPVGHRLTILRVCDDADADNEGIIAYCRTQISPDSKDVIVGYGWGMNLCLERAPWEPNTAPNQRESADPRKSRWVPPK